MKKSILIMAVSLAFTTLAAAQSKKKVEPSQPAKQQAVQQQAQQLLYAIKPDSLYTIQVPGNLLQATRDLLLWNASGILIKSNLPSDQAQNNTQLAGYLVPVYNLPPATTEKKKQ